MKMHLRDEIMTSIDNQINAKYESRINRLITESNRIKLPRLVENIKYNSKYMVIDSDWSSSWNEVTKSRLIESLIINNQYSSHADYCI